RGILAFATATTARTVLFPPEAAVRRPQTPDCGLLPCPKGRAARVEPEHAFHSSPPLRVHVLADLRACPALPERALAWVFACAGRCLRPSTLHQNQYREAVPSSRSVRGGCLFAALCPGACCGRRDFPRVTDPRP